MRTSLTCNTCTVIQKDESGKVTITKNPDSECHCRKDCPDDGSSTEKREQTITEIGHLWEASSIATEI